MELTNKINQFIDRIKLIFNEKLVSIIFYGSIVSGAHQQKTSDYNVLIIVDAMRIHELHRISKDLSKWILKYRFSPLIFTTEQLGMLSRVFPIEFFDLQEQYQVVYGSDVLKSISLSIEDLKRQLIYEWNQKIIQIRSRVLILGTHPQELKKILFSSSNSALVLIQATLRIFQKSIPATKVECLVALRQHFEFDFEIFQMIHQFKQDNTKIPLNEFEILERYFQAMEQIVVELYQNHLKEHF
jgi:predicted nucleotidyltransferase